MLLPLLALSCTVVDLPVGSSPLPVASPHFPDRLHAFVFRNWQLVPAERMAAVVGAKADDVLRLGHAMGLAGPPRITADQQRRSYITVIRRNWHLLPYDQMLKLLGWSEDKLAYTLREDDFLYAKLGSLKPKSDPLRWQEPDDKAKAREAEIARILYQELGENIGVPKEPLFGFVKALSTPPGKRPITSTSTITTRTLNAQRPTPIRLCYSYFATYGDPLLTGEPDPYPDGYLARLAEVGVNAVWLQGVLYKLAPFPWQPELSARYQERLRNLRALTERAKRHGIRVFLYLNEPRAMPLAFFAKHPELKGATEGDYVALCTSRPEVRKYLTDSVASICAAVPEIGGFFTISASENLTNCWSHYTGKTCPLCSKREPAEVVAEVNGAIFSALSGTAGQRDRGTTGPAVPLSPCPTLLVWDWGWQEEWVPGIIERLPRDVRLMSVSEWDLPIERGGIKSAVGEYSLSSIGPGPRAMRHWALAKARGIRPMAKVQASNSWELSAVPYVPAVFNAAEHAARLRDGGVEDIMLGWTLGGYPSPNLRAVARVLAHPDERTDMAILHAAEGYLPFDDSMRAVSAWRTASTAFRQYPFHIGVAYNAPQQMGPANPLWEKKTGYRATMVGFPYDDLPTWRDIYPPQVFIGQFQKVANGFDEALRTISRFFDMRIQRTPDSLGAERSVMEASAIHFHSVANQARFVVARDALAAAHDQATAGAQIAELRKVLQSELDLARRLYHLQSRDSRLGFEATNQYYYVPLDLAEKVLNCRDLLDRWLPAEAARHTAPIVQ